MFQYYSSLFLSIIIGYTKCFPGSSVKPILSMSSSHEQENPLKNNFYLCDLVQCGREDCFWQNRHVGF